MYRTFSILLIAIAFSSCTIKKTIYVAPNLVACEGTTSQKCMQIKEEIGDEWSLINDTIEGFEYQEGFTHKIEVMSRKMKNPSANESKLTYLMFSLRNVKYVVM